MSKVILDSVDGIEIDFETFPVKNLHAIYYLPEGLHLLATSIRAKEIEAVSQYGADMTLWLPRPDEVAFLTNWFSWFSVSLVSYLRLVKILGLMEENGWNTSDLKNQPNREEIKTCCTSYVKTCVPSIYHWRNKIGAHMAFTDPFVNDSLGTLEASLITPVAYLSPYFRAGAYNWGTQGETSDFSSWAASEVFELLSTRFWPNRRLQTLKGAIGAA